MSYARPSRLENAAGGLWATFGKPHVRASHPTPGDRKKLRVFIARIEQLPARSACAATAALAARPREAPSQQKRVCAVRQGENATAAEGDLRAHDLRRCRLPAQWHAEGICCCNVPLTKIMVWSLRIAWPRGVPNASCSFEHRMTGVRMCRGAHVIDIFGEESLPDGAARSWYASGRSAHRTPICDARRFPHSVISVAV